MKKTTSQNLSSRLAHYGALTLAIAGIADINGQIIYTDVSPDSDGTNIANGFIEFDLDGDAVNDFRLRHKNSNNKLEVTPLLGGSVLGNGSGGAYDNYTYPYAIDSGSVISVGKTTWNNNLSQTLNISSCYYSGADFAQWCDVVDKYLGLRFTITDPDTMVETTHYGWARLDVSKTLEYPDNWWILKDFAYESTPDKEITAGDNSLGIEDNSFNKIKIIALNKSIALYNLPQKTDYKVFNMSGQTVLTGKIENNTSVIEANTLSNGIYIIELQDVESKAVIRKKIVL